MSAKVIGAACAAVVLATLTAFGPAGSAHAAESSSASYPEVSYPEAQRILRELTAAGSAGSPGALAEVNGARGRTLLTSGVADVTTQAPMQGGRFRIGSITKTFTATVVLQLVGEGEIKLDSPVERYLPGLIRGNNNDGRDITVRQLLQHTSGLPDYLDDGTLQEFLKDPFAHHEARDLLGTALAQPRQFEPGKSWAYSNTNYIVAGMLIEKVTGHAYGKEIERRIIKPLKLRDTFVPGDQSGIPGPHPRGYIRPGDSALVDLTEFNPTVASAAGSMISSSSDLNRFFEELVNGRLLHPAERRAMMTPSAVSEKAGRSYGLGLESWKLPCGGRYWGHEGDIFGFTTKSGVTTGHRQVSVMTNLNPGGNDTQDTDMRKVITSALCTG